MVAYFLAVDVKFVVARGGYEHPRPFDRLCQIELAAQ